MSHTITRAENEEKLIKHLSALMERISNDSIKEHGAFNVGFSGGSMVRFIKEGLKNIKTDLSKWKIYFCDERVVPENSSDSTYGTYRKELGDLFKVYQYVPIKQGLTAEEAAMDYTDMLKHISRGELPQFDMLLLGMGPDGHICSLFPGHELVSETKKWVAPITNSPKPPPERITLTFPVINNAKTCIIAVCDENKADTVKHVLNDKEDLPATRIKLTSGDCYWILDAATAKYLPY